DATTDVTIHCLKSILDIFIFIGVRRIWRESVGLKVRGKLADLLEGRTIANNVGYCRITLMPNCRQSPSFMRFRRVARSVLRESSRELGTCRLRIHKPQLPLMERDPPAMG